MTGDGGGGGDGLCGDGASFLPVKDTTLDQIAVMVNISLEQPDCDIYRSSRDNSLGMHEE